MSAEYTDKERQNDVLSESLIDQLYDRPHHLISLITVPPKTGEKWTEAALQKWLDVVAHTARLVYSVEDESATKEGDTSYFKARYLDALLTSLEQEVEAGEGLSEPSCVRIEDVLDRWDYTRAPWLRDMYPAPPAALVPEAPPESTKAEPDQSEQEPPFAALLAAAEAEAPAASEPDAEGFEAVYQPTEPYRPMRERITDALTEADQPLARQELYDAIGQGAGVPATAARMVEEGTLVAVDEPDGWALPQHVLKPDEPSDAGWSHALLKERVFGCIEASPRVALKKREIHSRLLKEPGFLEAIGGMSGDPLNDILHELVDEKKIEKCGTTSATCFRLWAKPSDEPTRGRKSEEAAQRNASDMEARIAEVAESARRAGKARPEHPVTVRHVDPETLSAGQSQGPGVDPNQ